MVSTLRRFQANNFDSIADSIYSVENLHPYIGFEVINRGESLVWNFILPPATDPMNFIIYQAVVKRDGDGFKVTLTAEDNNPIHMVVFHHFHSCNCHQSEVLCLHL